MNFFVKLTSHDQGPRLISFMDEAPSWSYLPFKQQISVAIFIFIFTAAFLVPLIILVQYSSAELLAVLMPLHVSYKTSLY